MESLFNSPWWHGMRLALADVVDTANFPFAARLIREDVRAYATIPITEMDRLEDDELGAQIRELAEDGIMVIAIEQGGE